MEMTKAKTDKTITNMYKIKQFFKMVFDTEIGAMGNLKDNQFIRIFQAKDDYSKVEFFNNIDDVVSYVSNKRYGINTYYNLSTTNGESGQVQDLMTRSVIALDFDKKELGQDFNHIDLLNRFKAVNNLWYNALVDSGHGYHAYICIEPTSDIDKVIEVTKAIGKLLGADNKAMKTTQILRVPYTFNIKDPAAQKQVNIIKMFKLDTIKRHNINSLYNRFCLNERDKQEKGAVDRVTQFTISNTNIPSCIEKIIVEGSDEGKRYDDLQKIVVTLRGRNKSVNEIKVLIREWASKSNYKDNTDYRVEHIYNNLMFVKLDCKGCKHSKECFDKVESDFNYPDDFNLINMSETHTSKLRKSNRKGAKIMESNDILIYGILKNHDDGLYREEIIKELTYRNTVCLSEPTLRKALQSLEKNNFIEVISEGRTKFYKLKDIRSDIELTYNISYAATYEAIKGHISTEELRLYNYMRYLHNKQQREDSKALKGNLFQINQDELAKDLGISQSRVSQMIHNLLFEKLISVWYRQPSKNNGFDYYIYRLNY